MIFLIYPDKLIKPVEKKTWFLMCVSCIPNISTPAINHIPGNSYLIFLYAYVRHTWHVFCWLQITSQLHNRCCYNSISISSISKLHNYSWICWFASAFSMLVARKNSQIFIFSILLDLFVHSLSDMWKCDDICMTFYRYLSYFFHWFIQETVFRYVLSFGRTFWYQIYL